MSSVHESKSSFRIAHLLSLLEMVADSSDKLISLSNSRGPASGVPIDTRLEGVFDYIYDNFSTEISFDHAVKIACMSPSAFSRFFKQSTTLSFTEFLNRLRVSNACRLLIDTNKAVTDIAFDYWFWKPQLLQPAIQNADGTDSRAFRMAANG